MAKLTEISDEIAIAAPPEAVWRLLTQPDGPRRWMDGAAVRSDWTVGAPVEIELVLEGVLRRDRGTVLAVEPGRLLRYSHWSEISRRPDTPETRSEVTFELTASDDGTRLRVTQSRLTAAAAGLHARFFWRSALTVLRDEAEGRPTLALPRLPSAEADRRA